MNKKTFKKRAFISAIAMLVVSAIVLTSATFAWFAMSTQVKVDQMQLSITAPEGVQISGNPFVFTTNLLYEDLQKEFSRTNNRFGSYIGNKNYFASMLKPVSSAFANNSADNGNNPGFPKFLSGDIDSTGSSISTADLSVADDTTYYGEMGSGYTVFDVFVKVSYNRKVYFSDSTITCSSNTDVPCAMRMGFVYCGVLTEAVKEDGSDVSKILELSPGGTRINNQVVMAFDADHHTADAIALHGITEGTSYTTNALYSPRDSISLVKDANTNWNIVQYNGGYTQPPWYEVDKLKNNSLVAYDNGTKTTSNIRNYFSVKEGINRIRVYIWMEGQDYDCATDVAGNDIAAQVIFKVDVNETDPNAKS